METPIIFLEENVNRIWMKRDDLIPFSFGGNKARKAQKFFKEIDNGNYNCVVTYGSSSSNHCRVISNMAAARGIKCCIIMPEEASQKTFNSKMMDLFGAETMTVPVDKVHDTIEWTVEELKQDGWKPYFIPGGGHGNLGTQAYVECFEEILSFESRKDIFFDYIFFASGTGTTQAGLVCGQLLHSDDRSVVGISIARKNPRGRQIVLDSVTDYMEEKVAGITFEEIDRTVNFVDDYVDLGYGRANKDISCVIVEMLTQHGIPLDSTYTGKAYAGMKDYIFHEHIQGKNILFIHTGGTPLFFDDMVKLL